MIDQKKGVTSKITKTGSAIMYSKEYTQCTVVLTVDYTMGFGLEILAAISVVGSGHMQKNSFCICSETIAHFLRF